MANGTGGGGEDEPRLPWGALVWLLLGVALAALASAMPARAGAWTREKGRLYNRVAASWYATSSQYDAEGRKGDIPFHGEFRELGLVNYAEYGLASRLTVLGSVAVKRLRLENDIRITRTWGLGDIDAGLRWKVADGSAGVASVQGLVKIPSGYDTGASVPLPLGNGEFEYDLHLLYGRSLHPLLPGYWGAEVGYRIREGAPENEFRYLVEAGTDLGRHWYLRAKLDGVRGRSGAAVDVNGNPTVRNAYDLGTLDVTAGRRLGSEWFLEAGVAPSLYGRTTTAGSRWSLALAISR